MRAVITGGAGFLGSHLADRLIERGWEVVVVDNLLTGSLENLAAYGLAQGGGIEGIGNDGEQAAPSLPSRSRPSSSPLTFMRHDVSRHIVVEGPVDFVFHFASPASPVDFERYPIQVLKAGSLGTHNALGLAKAKRAKFLLASTSEVYGDPLVSPQPETYWGNVNPIGPRGVYDEAKRFAEAMTMAYRRMHGIPTRVARFFNTYGPRMRLDDGRVVPNFLAQALRGEPLTVYGDGTQTRSFCFVDDTVEGTLRLAGSDCYEPINIGSEFEYTVLEFAETVLRLTGSSSKIEFLPALPDDPKQRRPDLTRARSVLGWAPKVPVEEGLRRTIASFQKRLAV